MSNNPLDDPQYNQLYDNAIAFQQRFHDYTNKGEAHTRPEMHTLQSETHQLLQDIAVGHHPKAIDSRIHMLQTQLIQAKYAPKPLMDMQHHDALHQHLESMRREVKQFKNY